MSRKSRSMSRNSRSMRMVADVSMSRMNSLYLPRVPCRRAVLTGPLEAGGQVLRLVDVVQRDQLI